MERAPMLEQWWAGSRRVWQALDRRFRRARVRISFDIDDTLACQLDHSAVEHSRLPAFVHRWLGEPLRIGTRSLIRDLRRQGCSIWIYTSSGRSPSYIRRWLLLYGIRVDGVVNSDRHYQAMAEQGLCNAPSKYPLAFDIDLHVDDSEGVRIEGVEHGFRVVVVDPQDASWARKVLDAAEDVQARLAWQQPLRHEAPVRRGSEALAS